MEDGEFKKCPFCKEQIRKEAVKCRFCGEWLEQTTQKGATVETTSLPPLPIEEEIQKPAEAEIKPAAQETNTQQISPKKLYWIGSGLLFGCGLFLVVWFTGIDWKQLSPEEADKATTNLATLITRTLLCAGLLAWTVKRKGFRFLTFSIVCAAMTVISVYYFHVGKTQVQQKEKDTWTKLSSNGMEFVQYAQQGGTGSVPTFRSVGNTDIDSLTQLLNGMIQQITQSVAKMNQDIDALEEQDAFASSLLTSKPNLEKEIPKRIESQKIIDQYEQVFVSQIEAARKKCETLNISDNIKRGGLDGLDKTVSQYQKILGLRSKEQKTEHDFLQFLSDSFEDYQLKDGTILFGSSKNSVKYNELANNVQNATKEMNAYFEERLNASKDSAQKISQ
jgi:hypothetical protein